MALSLPPAGAWVFAYVAVLPLVFASRICLNRTANRVVLVFLGSLPFWLFQDAFIINITPLGYLPMCMMYACFPAVFVWALAALHRRVPRVPYTLTVPLLWTGLEFFRAELLFDGYGWAMLAHPLIESPLFAAPGAWVGAIGVGFLAAMIQGAMVDAMVARGWFPMKPAEGEREGKSGSRAGTGAVSHGASSQSSTTSRRLSIPSLIGLVLFLLATLGSHVSLVFSSVDSGPRVTFAIVQTNVPQDNKLAGTTETEIEAWRELETLTREAAKSRPDVIVWPETMMPGLTLERAALDTLKAGGIVFPVTDAQGEKAALPAGAFAGALFSLQAEIGIPILLGEVGIENLTINHRADGSIDFHFGAKYNSAYVVSNGELQPERYDKMRLTPFGETMPYVRHWPWLQDKVLSLGARGMAFDLAAGLHPTVLKVRTQTLGEIRAVTPICYEVTYPTVCRTLVWEKKGSRRADVIVNLTNDGWFSWWDGGREQHLQIARWRCLELGTPMVRAANTGISALIDERGRVTRRSLDGKGERNSARSSGVVTGEVNMASGRTVYAMSGDVLGWLSLLGTGCAIFYALISGTVFRGKKRSMPS